MLLFTKLLILFSGFRLTRQEHSNDVLTLNCEAFKKVKQLNDMESVEWRVEGSGKPIAECQYSKNIPTPNCEVRKSLSLEAKGIKVLNISRANGALRILRLSRTNTARPCVVFLCAVTTSYLVYNDDVTVDFSVKCKL